MNTTPRSLSSYKRPSWDKMPYAYSGPLIESRRPVNRKSYTAGKFVLWMHQTSRGEESKLGVLLGSPYQTPTSATTYYCRILTPTGIFEKRVAALEYLNEPRQTPELKQSLEKMRQSLLAGGLEQLERSVPKITAHNKQEVLEQLLKDLDSSAIREALA